MIPEGEFDFQYDGLTKYRDSDDLSQEEELDYDQRKVHELSEKQQQLFKGIEQDFICSFQLPQFTLFIPEVQNSIRKMLNPDSMHRKLVQEQLNDRDLQDYLNSCKEDLYKQLLQKYDAINILLSIRYKGLLKTSLSNKWLTGTIKRAGQLNPTQQQKEEYHKNKTYIQGMQKINWFSIVLGFAGRLLKESDNETLNFEQRAQQRVHFLKMMCFVLQIESSEFTQLFKKMFDEL